jgi:hypothetical protein
MSEVYVMWTIKYNTLALVKKKILQWIHNLIHIGIQGESGGTAETS